MAKKTETDSKITVLTLWNLDRIKSSITECVKIFGPGSKSLELLHQTAFQCLYHASKHGDVTLCKRLFVGLGGSESNKGSTAALRVEAMKLWFAKMGPITAREGEWKLTDAYKAEPNPDAWKLEEAFSKPFWEFQREPNQVDVDLGVLLNIFKSAIKRMETANEQGKFKGSYDKTKAWAENVISFAEEQSKRISDKDKNSEDDNNKIIKNAVEKNARLIKKSA